MQPLRDLFRIIGEVKNLFALRTPSINSLIKLSEWNKDILADFNPALSFWDNQSDDMPNLKAPGDILWVI